MKQLYPDESGVFLERDKVITLEAKDDSVTATAQVTERILFLKDRPDNATDMHVYGSHFQDIENIQAATSVWEKSKYKDIALGGLTRQRENDASIFLMILIFIGYHFQPPTKVIRHIGAILKSTAMPDLFRLTIFRIFSAKKGPVCNSSTKRNLD